jgi:hypothetical protein
MGRAAIGSTAGVLAGLSLLASTGWAGAVLSIAVVFAIVGAACWVLGDQHRPRRLALLIRTCRLPAAGSAWPPTRPASGDRDRVTR